MRFFFLSTLALLACAFTFADASAQGRSLTINITQTPSGYSCEYAGGDNAKGDVNFYDLGTPETVTLHVGPGSFTIDKPNITVDPKLQLTVPSHSPTTAVIHDKNTKKQTGVYKVTAHAADGTAIPCDPGITNN